MVELSLIDLIITGAEVADGRRVPNGAALGIVDKTLAKEPRWSAEEDRFLKENMGRMTDAEIGAVLRRGENGVHLRAERTGLPRPSKDPNYLTANRAAQALGVDGHKTCYWIDSGMLKGERLAGPRAIRRIRKDIFLEWVLDPDHWIWFDPDRVPDPRIRILLEQKAQEWGDEWWNSRRVADFYGIEANDVKRHCKMGRIQGVQARNLGGRNNGSWAFWFFRRSEILRAKEVILATKRKVK